MAIEVRCTRKSDRGQPHERITHIGGFNGSSQRWWLPLQDAIERIESGRGRFYVSRNGRPVDVVVATGGDGTKHVRAVDEDDESDLLLRLPDYP